MNWDRVTQILSGRLRFKNAAMNELLNSLPRVGNASANVLILGESGTGKEIVAKLIHRLSARSENPFVAINCAAIPEALLESELFGHEKGAFTGANCSRRGLFQEADGGTLLLDEIGDMPRPLQAKLLRVLQERTVTPVGSSRTKKIDFRLIAATHNNLKQKVQEGTFRLDLFYRLNVIPLTVPPLRERREDIPELVQLFLSFYSQKYDTQIPIVSPEAMEVLISHQWDGNVRELENFIERLLVKNGHLNRISIDDVSDLETSSRTGKFHFPEKLASVDDLVAQYILHVCNEVDHHQGKAAEVLGISRRTIYRKMKHLTEKTLRPEC